MFSSKCYFNYINKYKILNKVKKIEKYFEFNLKKFKKYKFVRDTRYLGAIGVIEVKTLDKKL